tara:strand:- start:27 stop:245 length:219 start_codon:yes stop_codon:yes gene_type:complete
MKSILTGILSLVIFFGAVPTANAYDYEDAYLNEEMLSMNDDDVKKKKKKGKKLAGKGKKKKKGFFSKIFGSK